MHLQYIFHGQDKEPYMFHVKSEWMPLVQPSFALDSYLENAKTQLAKIPIIKPQTNLSRNKVIAPKELKRDSAINLEKQTKGQRRSPWIRLTN